jgi:hypothetical protein
MYLGPFACANIDGFWIPSEQWSPTGGQEQISGHQVAAKKPPGGIYTRSAFCWLSMIIMDNYEDLMMITWLLQLTLKFNLIN